jgi:hypothetical protein
VNGIASIPARTLSACAARWITSPNRAYPVMSPPR